VLCCHNCSYFLTWLPGLILRPIDIFHLASVRHLEAVVLVRFGFTYTQVFFSFSYPAACRPLKSCPVAQSPAPSLCLTRTSLNRRPSSIISLYHLKSMISSLTDFVKNALRRFTLLSHSMFYHIRLVLFHERICRVRHLIVRIYIEKGRVLWIRTDACQLRVPSIVNMCNSCFEGRVQERLI
jgi:hypothetical protein